MVGEISGALGNIVFARGKYGAVIRTRSMPTLVQNQYTADSRGRLASLSQAYAALTSANKQAWRTWAATNPGIDRLGDSITYQPSAAFIMLNANILRAGGTQIDDPPVVGAPAGVTGQAVTSSPTVPAVSVSWTSGALGASERLLVWGAVLDSPGRDYYRNLLKCIHTSVVAATTPLNISSDVVARFGTVIADQKFVIELEVIDEDTGLKSGRTYADCIVAV